jgi:hypothetical protein
MHMRIAVQAVQLVAVATVVQILSAQAFVPTGDVWITSANYVAASPQTPCSAGDHSAEALLPTGDVWIAPEPCSPPVLSAQKPSPNAAD